MTDTIPANVYTEAQHFALLESAVSRETATLAEAKKTLETTTATLESEKAALADELTGTKSKVDVLEAEKAAAEARADAAVKELADFKAELARQAEIADKRAARVDAVKAANASLGEDFFSSERAQRWAEMSDEAFASLVADMSEAAAAVKPAETASKTETTGEKSAVDLARESAAFTGGQTATATNGGGRSTTAQFLDAQRRGSAA